MQRSELGQFLKGNLPSVIRASQQTCHVDNRCSSNGSVRLSNYEATPTRRIRCGHALSHITLSLDGRQRRADTLFGGNMRDVTTIEQGGAAKVHDGVSGMQLQVNSCMPCESARNETMYNSDLS